MAIIISDHNRLIENQTYTGSLYARMPHPDGRPYHTFRTATVLVDGENLTFKNCRFVNDAGPGDQVGQAIALCVDGDGIEFIDCVIEGNQDTLFLAPLPPTEYEKDGFLGPKQYEARTMRHVKFTRCTIRGSIDFVFGGAYAEFTDCTFVSTAPGYVFAPCTPEGEEHGFVVQNCTFTADEGVPPQSCYIARPWRDFANVELTHCKLDSHIHPEGWHDWGKTEAHDTVHFVEVDSYGPGAEDARRPEYCIFSKQTVH